MRGLSPYPAAWSEFVAAEGAAPLSMKIFATKVSCEAPSQSAPGTVEVSRHALKVVCGDGLLLDILSLQPTGKKRMSADEFLRGARLGESPRFA